MKNLHLTGLLLAGLLFSALMSFAQIATVTDNSCTDVNQQCEGPGSHGCTVTAFTVPTSGTYVLYASMDNCESCTTCNCLAEAYIAQHGSTAHIYCVHNDCGGSCQTQHMNVTLDSGITYDLYACKTDCPGVVGCDDCYAAGAARATVTR
jgi:hypothetical protein